MKKEFDISHYKGIPCFKVIISQNDNSVAVACPLDAQRLYEQVLNAVNLGNVVTIENFYLPIADEGE